MRDTTQTNEVPFRVTEQKQFHRAIMNYKKGKRELEFESFYRNDELVLFRVIDSVELSKDPPSTKGPIALCPLNSLSWI